MSEHTRTDYLRIMLDTMSEGVALNEMVFDDRGEMVNYRVLQVNRAFHAVADRRGDEVVGRLATDLYGMSPEVIRAFWLAHRHCTEPQTAEFVSPLSHRVFQISTSPFVDRKFVTSFFDITELKRTTARLRVLGTAIEALADAVVVTDPAGVIEWANPAFSSLSGYGSDEYVGQAISALQRSGAHDATFHRKMLETLHAGQTWRGEVINRRKDGSLYTEDQTITPVKDDDGRVAHLIAVKQDITEWRSLEDQFRQAQKMESIGRLAGGIAHDFNNMLGVILGHAELAIADTDASDPLGARLREIHQAASRSAALTRQLLAFARKQRVTPRSLDLNAAVSESISMLRRMIGENIKVDWQPGADLWRIAADPSQLDQILANLCVNARDAIERVGVVTLSTRNAVADATFCARHPSASPGEFVCLTVADSGVGISAEVVEHIFEPFFTTKQPGHGTGLGLSTVHGAVHQNGGFILVRTVVGQGTAFEIYWPREAQPTGPRVETDGTARAQRGSETILVVEDEPTVLHMVKDGLEVGGYRVLTAGGPEEARRLLATTTDRIDLLLTDLVMPGLDGQGLAEEIARARPGIRTLFMSGYADGGERSRPRPAPMDLLPKPFAMSELWSAVRRSLDRGK